VSEGLIPIVCIGKSGETVTFNVRSIVSIDGRPLLPDQNDVIASILQRLAAVEEALKPESTNG
jgi:hypothetical protein